LSVPLIWINKSYSLKKKIIVTLIILAISAVLIALFYKSYQRIKGYYSEINAIMNSGLFSSSGNLF
ncbi:MAG: hypothetical protein FWC57_02280, partial [Endomicrobia bacterium]|nr:hypothetical protein [Endomicrobiia bacterium]